MQKPRFMGWRIFDSWSLQGKKVLWHCVPPALSASGAFDI
jgi:hypothetical protein